MSGTYYLRNTPYLAGYYGTYSLLVKKYSATSIVTFTNPTASATLNAGTSYSIQWIADTALFGTYVTLNLTQDTNQLLSINTYLANTTGTGSYSWTVPAMLGSAGNYHIRLASYNYSTIRGLSAGFTISGIAQDAYEPDNSVATAHAITINGVAENHTLPFNDTDYCQFSATANYLYVLKANGSIKPSMTLYNTNGTTLLTSANTAYTDTAATIAWFCPTAGTYYFRTISALYGSYQIAATGNDTSAYRITVTSPVTNDSLTIGQTYSIKWSSTITIGDSVDIFLYNNGNISTTIVSGVKNSGTYSWTVPSTITAGTTYSVKVSNRLNPSYIIGYSGVFVIKQ